MAPFGALRRSLTLWGLALALGLAGCGEPKAPKDSGGAQAPAKARARYDRDGNRLSGAAAPTRRPNLIVIVIDTLRADMLDGADRRMPWLAERAKAAVRFKNACAPAPWTVPSVTSLLTGLLPSVHGCDVPLAAHRVPEAITTFAEALHNGYGYETAAFTDGPWFDNGSQLLQGFEHAVHHFMFQRVNEMIAPWASKRDKARPFFLFLHTFEAHDPYGQGNHPATPPLASSPPFSSRDVSEITDPAELARIFLTDGLARMDLTHQRGVTFRKAVVKYFDEGYRAQPDLQLSREVKEAYASGATWVDGLLKSTLEQLEALGLMNDTLTVVTSDHGEAFGEHGTLSHGRQLYDELVRIPMVAFGPAPFDRSEEIAASVGLLDLMPTFLDWAGFEPLEGVNARSFLPVLTQGDVGRPVFSEERISRTNTESERLVQLTSVRSQHWKYIVSFDLLSGAVVEEVYDLESDPLERIDLCRGKGRIDGLTFDARFCTAIEQARDRIWGTVGTVRERFGDSYGVGETLVHSARPPACVSAGD